MSRPIKTGLEYFPFDVDLFDDPKILFVADRFDSKGEIVTIKLLCWIYRNGYSCEWNDEHALIFAKKNFSSIKASLCIDIVNELLKRGFFNQHIFETFGILTSKAIQKRWKNVIDRSKRKAELIPELNLLVTEETIPKQELTKPKTDESTQSKVKQSKVKQSKGEESKKKKSAIEILKKEKQSELDVLWMQNKSKIPDEKKLIASFNDKMEFLLAKGELEFEAKQLMPKFRTYVRNWISNDLDDKRAEKLKKQTEATKPKYF